MLDRNLLETGLQDLGFSPDEEILNSLLKFGEELIKWNKVYNLTAISEPSEVVSKHLLDSSVLASFIKQRFEPSTECLDVGSGGGLPGIPCAILLPDFSFTLIDSIGKKVNFLKQMRILLQCSNLFPIQGRVEQLKTTKKYSIISSRAFTSLTNFVQLTEHLIEREGYWLAMKGKTHDEELEEVKKIANVLEVIKVKVPYLEDNRCIVVMTPKE